MSGIAAAGRTMTAAQQWAALQGALQTETAACAGNTAFTGERGDLAATARMRASCTACPVLEQCRDYAETAARSTAPITGFWAGRWR